MQALVVVAHGSHLNPDSSTPTYRHADTVRETGVFDEVATAFWKEEPSFREVLRTLNSEEVYVVPLFISEGYFTEQVIPRELRLAEFDVDQWDSDGTSASSTTLRATDVDKTVHYCGPAGTHDAMTDVIVRRAESVTGDDEVGEGFGLAVVGHGTERNENSAKAIRYHADRIRESGRFDEDIPEDMGLTDDYRTGWDTPTEVDGVNIWYAGAVGTEPLMADVLLERARDAGAAVGTAVEEVREQTRAGAD